MKKLFLVLLCAIALMLSACSMNDIRDAIEDGVTDIDVTIDSSGSGEENTDEEFAYENDAEKLLADLTLHNGYLGVSYTIPSGWWLYEINGDNFTEDAADTSDPTTMDIFYGEGYDYIDLAYFSSLQYSSKDNHIGIDITAERVEDVDTLEDYMIDYIDYMLEPYEGNTYELQEESDVTLQGRDFHQCVFFVNQEGRSYNILSMTTEVNDGYFLTVSGNYWPDNKKAVENIIQYVDNGLRFL